MSLMRTLSVWTLRGLIAWGALEMGASLYDDVTARSADLAAIGTQHEVSQRLSARAASAEANASMLDQRLNALLHVSWSPVAANDPRAAADTLRQQLIDLGAQAPVVDAELAPAGDHVLRVAFTARWREPVETAPSVLHALAARYPDLAVSHLALNRSGVLIETEARFIAIAPSLAPGARP